ncbi:uncharacterized protein LOC108698364 [Xenopus laevis]|uniref:Uncharacterized protein LOC108698364 n=2 Tax=Xenopus laevis TaxID=8355 RepID=A0A1L8HTQ8_XENLA|nr:uncharacterized protein LOC108698364 [Xenopus laevis]OCT99492.1 hypothetical protein XELAEV_18005274mg [Xenopus laevis]
MSSWNIMDEIHSIQNWARYNAKLRTLQQTLGLPSLEKAKNSDWEKGQRWSRYNDQVNTLQQKLGLQSHDFKRHGMFDQASTPLAAPAAAFLPSKQYTTGWALSKEVLKYFGPGAYETMIQSYCEGSAQYAAASPPRQETIDRILIRRNIARAEQQQNNDKAIRKLNDNKEHLRKAIKTLEMRNEFFRNERTNVFQPETPPAEQHPTDPRQENEIIKPTGTDLLKDLDNDHLFLDEVVEEVLNRHLSLAPRKMSPGTEKKHKKLMSEMFMDRAVQLITEEIILETTMQMSKHLATDAIKRIALSSEFGSKFYSTKVQDYLKEAKPLYF